VLAFVAFASAPVAREARAAQAGKEVQSSLSGKQRAFIAFILEHYVKEGVEQLDVEKLAPLLRLKYGSIEDATANLGPPAEIRRVFVEFQRYLYQQKKAA